MTAGDMNFKVIIQFMARTGTFWVKGATINNYAGTTGINQDSHPPFKYFPLQWSVRTTVRGSNSFVMNTQCLPLIPFQVTTRTKSWASRLSRQLQYFHRAGQKQKRDENVGTRTAAVLGKSWPTIAFCYLERCWLWPPWTKPAGLVLGSPSPAFKDQAVVIQRWGFKGDFVHVNNVPYSTVRMNTYEGSDSQQ